MEARGSAVSVEPFGNAEELLRSLRSGGIDAAVRGTLGSVDAIRELKRSFSIEGVMRAAILEDASLHPFILAPVGIDEGSTMATRLELALATVAYFGSVQWSLRIGVLSKGRPEDASRGRAIKESIEDAEKLVGALRSKGFEARHYGILIEDAARECDFVLPPDGVSGNLIFRTLHFLGGCTAFGAPVVNIAPVFVDTSRAKAGFLEPVLLAAGLAEARRKARPRA
ncbi:MAG: hypothetical protein A3K67_02840 [Euryarchaeota archaeon RBG_16_62_10]|nr:MAG: hypothetical protein A3K67_02840 [Euryarchaeota archaeon RBG_16_62_10]